MLSNSRELRTESTQSNRPTLVLFHHEFSEKLAMADQVEANVAVLQISSNDLAKKAMSPYHAAWVAVASAERLITDFEVSVSVWLLQQGLIQA